MMMMMMVTNWKGKGIYCLLPYRRNGKKQEGDEREIEGIESERREKGNPEREEVNKSGILFSLPNTLSDRDARKLFFPKQKRK